MLASLQVVYEQLIEFVLEICIYLFANRLVS